MIIGTAPRYSCGLLSAEAERSPLILCLFFFKQHFLFLFSKRWLVHLRRIAIGERLIANLVTKLSPLFLKVPIISFQGAYRHIIAQKTAAVNLRNLRETQKNAVDNEFVKHFLAWETFFPLTHASLGISRSEKFPESNNMVLLSVRTERDDKIAWL